jgi:hypothetical protein
MEAEKGDPSAASGALDFIGVVARESSATASANGDLGWSTTELSTPLPQHAMVMSYLFSGSSTMRVSSEGVRLTFEFLDHLVKVKMITDY